MERMRRAGLAALFALCLIPLPAAAGSQSSNSSSNCSNGRCTRVESYILEDRGWRQGWTRVERWREGPRMRDEDRLRAWPFPGVPPRAWHPRRDEDDD